MAAVSTPSEVAGRHIAVYEAFYGQVDPAGTGSVGALDAATFLKKSGLRDTVLSKIWDLSDPSGRGFLDKYGFFVALKLVSLAQAGNDVSASSLILDTPPPSMGDSLPILSSPSHIDWTIKASDKTKYDQLFESLGPLNDKLPSSRVKPVMLNSKLPVDTLSRVWDLSDLDGDGFLDRDEFALAMHLIYKALENHPVPHVLPPEMIPASKQKRMLVGAIKVLPSIGEPHAVVDPIRAVMTPPPIPALPAEVTTKNAQNRQSPAWIVSAGEKAKFDIMFKNADLDADGFVNGQEIRDIFLASGLSQPILAHVWNLCDIKRTGRLNAEQFALAMHLVEHKLQGVEPPSALTPEMIPPLFRPKPGVDGTISEVGAPTTVSNYENPELDLITKGIEELTKEKHQLEQDVTQREADIRIKNGEIKLLSGELSTLAATLKQLEMQRGEAQKRLDELDIQKSSLGKSLDDLREQMQAETEQVNNLKAHLQEQENAVKDQEIELSVKKKELNELKSEEGVLEHQVQSGKAKLDQLNKNLQETLLQISQSKVKITHLEENQRQLNDVVAQYDLAIVNRDASNISQMTFKIHQLTNLDLDYYSRLENGGGSSVSSLECDADPFSANVAFPVANGFSSDPFSSHDPFKDADPFNDGDISKVTINTFDKADPFKDSFASGDLFKDKETFDDFTSQSDSAPKIDPFDPFVSGVITSRDGFNTQKEDMNGDLFGSDPFGPPPVVPRSESPTPALPPKKSKQPPPRPAPPRNSGAKPPRAAPPAPSPVVDPFAAVDSEAVVPSGTGVHGTTDPFAAVFGNDPFDPFGGGDNAVRQEDPFDGVGKSADAFANFADFDNKFSSRSLSEDEQLEWAKTEGVRLEKDRQMRAAKMEQAELELALALSKAEADRKT